MRRRSLPYQINKTMLFAEYTDSDFQGAGFVFISPLNKALILQKPNKKWCFVGGKRKGNETPSKTAKREAKEEIGFVPKGTVTDFYKHKKADEDVYVFSFIMYVDEEFKPELDSEHIDYKWVRIKNLKDYLFSTGVVNLIPILQRTYNS